MFYHVTVFLLWYSLNLGAAGGLQSHEETTDGNGQSDGSARMVKPVFILSALIHCNTQLEWCVAYSDYLHFQSIRRTV